MEEILGYIATIVGTLGGWECIKYILNRKTNKRKEVAEAEREEFANMKEQIEFMSEQMKLQQEQIAEQQAKILQLTSEIAHLKLQLDKTKCEVPHCAKRVPPSDY